MSFLVKVYRHFTSVLLCTHGRFLVSKSDFKLVSCWTYILNITFVTSDQVNNIFRFSDQDALKCWNQAKKTISSLSRELNIRFRHKIKKTIPLQTETLTESNKRPKKTNRRFSKKVRKARNFNCKRIKKVIVNESNSVLLEAWILSFWCLHQTAKNRGEGLSVVNSVLSRGVPMTVTDTMLFGFQTRVFGFDCELLAVLFSMLWEAEVEIFTVCFCLSAYQWGRWYPREEPNDERYRAHPRDKLGKVISEDLVTWNAREISERSKFTQNASGCFPLEGCYWWNFEKMVWIEIEGKKGIKGYTHKSDRPLTGSGVSCCGGGLSGLRLLIIHLKL